MATTKQPCKNKAINKGKGKNKEFIENQWKKGKSGNPKGRPPVFSLTDMIRRKLQEMPKDYKGTKKSYAEILVGAILEKGIVEKDHQTQKLILNYIEGMPVARVANADGSNLFVNDEKKAEIKKALDNI